MFTGVLVCLQQRLRVAMSALAHKIVGDERQSCPVPSWCLYTSQSLSPSHNTIGHQEGEELSNVENNEGKTILCILSPSSVMNFEILRHRRLIYSYLLTSTHCAFLPPSPRCTFTSVALFRLLFPPMFGISLAGKFSRENRDSFGKVSFGKLSLPIN